MGAAVEAITDQINPDDAMIVLKIRNCIETSDDIENALASVLAASLRIAVSRVTVSVTVDEENNDGCFATVTITQVACDSFTIENLIHDFEHMVKDPFSELHGAIYKEEDIPQSYLIDNDVFYVSQFPATILVQSDSLRVDFSNANVQTNTGDATLYITIGLAVGIVVAGIVLAIIHKSKNPKSKEVEFQPVRRSSIADFLANKEDKKITSPSSNGFKNLQNAFGTPAPAVNTRKKSVADILAERNVSGTTNTNLDQNEDKKDKTTNQAMSSLLGDELSDDSSDSEVEDGLEGLF